MGEVGSTIDAALPDLAPTGGAFFFGTNTPLIPGSAHSFGGPISLIASSAGASAIVTPRLAA